MDDPISEPKPAGLAVENDASFRTLFATSLDAVLLTTPDGRILAANAAACRMFGRTENELIRLGRAGVVDAADPRLSAALEERARTGAFRGELTFIRSSGEKFPGEISSAIFRGRNGTERASMVIRDITGNRRVETVLRESEERFRKVFEEGLLGMVMADEANGRFLRANAAYCQMMGYTEEELQRLTFMEVTHHEHRAVDAAAIKRLWAGQLSQYRTEKRYLKKSGETFWGALNVSLVRSDDGRPLYSLAMIEDITERKRLAALVEEERNRLASLLSSIPEEVWFADTRGQFILASASALRAFNLEQAGGLSVEKLERSLEVFRPDGSPRPVAEAPPLRALAGEDVRNFEEIIRMPGSGELRHRLVNAAPVKDAAGSIVGAVSVVRDITAQKQAERDLCASTELLRALASHLQTVREEERTHLAREIHDVLAQGLTRLKIDLVWLQRRLARPRAAGAQESLAARVGEMSQMADEAIHCVQRIATGLRPAVLDSLGLCAAVEWQAHDFQAHAGIPCRASVPQEELPMDREAATAAFRILQESLTNVQRHAQATRVEVALRQEAGQLILTVQDDGRGIRAEELLSPLSVGLEGMRERAQLLGGQLEIRGQPGAGTTIEMRLPLAAEAENSLQEDS